MTTVLVPGVAILRRPHRVGEVDRIQFCLSMAPDRKVIQTEEELS